VPENLTPNLGQIIVDLLESNVSYTQTRPIVFGATSGSGGGIGAPPGGFIGKLGQRYVAYDTDELETLETTGSSLVDNLNHVRYRIAQLEDGAGLTTETPGNVAAVAVVGTSGSASHGDHVHKLLLGSGLQFTSGSLEATAATFPSTQIGQILYSINGTLFSAQLPVTDDAGWLVEENNGILLVVDSP